MSIQEYLKINNSMKTLSSSHNLFNQNKEKPETLQQNQFFILLTIIIYNETEAKKQQVSQPHTKYQSMQNNLFLQQKLAIRKVKNVAPYHHNRQTPNKFYTPANAQSKRATSLGFGKKTTLENKNIADPGLYNIKSSFDVRKISNTRQSLFGESHQKIYERMVRNSRTPGPGSYEPNATHKSNFYIGQKLRITSQQSYPSPQQYNINDDLLSKISRHPKQKSFRIHTEGDDRLALKKFDNKKPGPGYYNIDSGLSIEEVMKKNRMRSNFSRTNRLLPIRTEFSTGPGSYAVFSAFGNLQQD